MCGAVQSTACQSVGDSCAHVPTYAWSEWEKGVCGVFATIANTVMRITATAALTMKPARRKTGRPGSRNYAAGFRVGGPSRIRRERADRLPRMTPRLMKKWTTPHHPVSSVWFMRLRNAASPQSRQKTPCWLEVTPMTTKATTLRKVILAAGVPPHTMQASRAAGTGPLAGIHCVPFQNHCPSGEYWPWGWAAGAGEAGVMSALDPDAGMSARTLVQIVSPRPYKILPIHGEVARSVAVGAGGGLQRVKL